MASITPTAWEQNKFYWNTTTGGATAAAANRVGDFDGNPSFNVTMGGMPWFGQDRFAKQITFTRGEATVTIPGVQFDPDEEFAKFWKFTKTAADTLHGGAAAAASYALGANVTPQTAEFLLEGIYTSTAKRAQILIPKGYIDAIPPTLGLGDFAKLDLTIKCLQDANGVTLKIFTEI